jgi:hypothetical protein
MRGLLILLVPKQPAEGKVMIQANKYVLDVVTTQMREKRIDVAFALNC